MALTLVKGGVLEAVNQFDDSPHFFTVRLDLFDGPIDLLLHLVKQSELPIEKVALAEVTNQYLACLEQARAIDLDIAAEYLVIAATLLSIKSSILLNQPVEFVEDEDGNLVDPHEELLKKLREAAIYQDGAKLLQERDFLGVDVFSPPTSLKQVEGETFCYQNHDPLLLGRAFKKLLDQVGANSALYTVMANPVSVLDLMMKVLDRLEKAGGELEFEKLIPDHSNRLNIIGCFVAMLELCKRQIIKVRQQENFEQIYICLASTRTIDVDLSSEFDVAEENPDLATSVNF